MGCDIHSFTEVKNLETGRWEKSCNFIPSEWHLEKYEGAFHNKPFRTRDYSVFAFLADVRNYWGIDCIALPKGLPSDLSPDTKEFYEEWRSDAHTESYLTLRELLDFDYQKVVKNKKGEDVTGPHLGPNTFRQFLGPSFIEDLELLSKLGEPENVRVVFWFDN